MEEVKSEQDEQTSSTATQIEQITSPTTSNPSKLRFLLIGLFTVLLLLGIGVGILVYGKQQNKSIEKNQAAAISPAVSQSVPRSDSMGNWKTYSNTTYGFSIKHPKDWTTSLDSRATDTLVTVLIEQIDNSCSKAADPDACSNTHAIAISVYDNPQKLSVERFNEPHGEKEGFTYKYKQITVNGISGVQTSDIPGVYDRNNIFISKDSKIYQLEWIKGGSAKDEIPQELYMQIIDSFTFTDQVGDQISQKTYQNPKYQDFSFTYPSDWKIVQEKEQEHYLNVVLQHSSGLQLATVLGPAGVGGRCADDPNLTLKKEAITVFGEQLTMFYHGDKAKNLVEGTYIIKGDSQCPNIAFIDLSKILETEPGEPGIGLASIHLSYGDNVQKPLATYETKDITAAKKIISSLAITK